MASGKGVVLNTLGRLVLRQGRVTRLREPSPRFRWLDLRLDEPAGTTWTPGDKVQLLLPDLEVRTFTPMTWNYAEGTTELLVYRNQPPAQDAASEHPGTRWLRTVQVGDACRFVGPQRSLALPADAPFVLFGDETSFAVARALRGAAPTSAAFVFEVEATAAVRPVLEALGLADAVCIERAAADAHVPAVNEQLERLLADRSGAKLLMTGRAQAIQALQSLRRAAGQTRPHKTKAYWSLGKAGLD